ncbi:MULTISPECIES: FtsW/RodA/SpoVE family cell cycle protein [unclassified Helicobacter]|uniref:FtsW/RodA/SpoVE family cell cycle protein n=1 Tax=unclassified Helicobacter TaxID=2593540 RepID=UPI0009EF2847|nr:MULTISPECIES: FtsW/RodA/SpoVE family cell cycle protein [unclassified Helicobacter]
MIDRRILIHFDLLLPLLIVPIIALSYFLIGEASVTQNLKQTIYILLGFVAFLVAFFVPIRRLNKSIVIFYWLCIVLLILVYFIGTKQLGAQRWIMIGSFSIQPSEPVKIAIILLLGLHIHNNPPPPGGYGIKQFATLSFYILLPFVLILKQPDLGTALVVLFVGFGTLFLIGVNYKIWVAIIAGVLVASPLIYGSLKEYQIKRIHDFIAEKPSYHVQQSIITIGSGGLLGKKKEESTQTRLKFLPIATSDFIFAYFSERYGFLGGVALIALYCFLTLHVLSFSLIDPKDYRLRTMSCAIALLLFFYVSVNIGMTIGLAPVVGIPLPLFSYGGSSFITFMVLFGILENLLAFRFNFSYNPNPFKAILRNPRRKR